MLSFFVLLQIFALSDIGVRSLHWGEHASTSKPWYCKLCHDLLDCATARQHGAFRAVLADRDSAQQPTLMV